MNLKQSRRKDGRVYLTIETAYRDERGRPRSKTVLSLGWLDVMEKQYDDPIAHFKEVDRIMTAEEQADSKVKLPLDMNERLEPATDNEKNFGYAAILKIYNELGLYRFFSNKASRKNFKLNTNSIMTLLVISRLLSPGSKRKAFQEKDRYYERLDITQAAIYRALSHISEISKECQRHMHTQIEEKYGRHPKTNN